MPLSITSVPAIQRYLSLCREPDYAEQLSITSILSGYSCVLLPYLIFGLGINILYIFTVKPKFCGGTV